MRLTNNEISFLLYVFNGNYDVYPHEDYKYSKKEFKLIDSIREKLNKEYDKRDIQKDWNDGEF